MARRKKNKILLICGNWGLREALTLLLEKEFKVISSLDMEDGLRQQKVDPDIILIDDDTPGFSSKMLESYFVMDRGTPFIILFIDFMHAEKYKNLYENESFEILEKPFNNDIVLNKIESLIGRIISNEQQDEILVREKEIELDSDSIPEKMDFLKLFVQENYDSISTVKKLADEVNMGYRTLLRCFSDYFQMPIKEYINDVRLEKMVQFIQFTNMDVQEICLRVGFKDKQHAVKLFKYKYGFTPHDGIEKFRQIKK